MITDPFFYAVTVPAVLLLGISKSGFGAGFGALAVPIMALAVSVPQAAAILMPVLLLMDVLGIVGVCTLLFLAQRLVFPPRPNNPPPPKWLGAVLGTLSGFTSFVAHAGGPPINAYVIPLKLSPVKLTATLAYFFFVVNLSKWIPYAWLGLLDMRNLSTSLVLLPLAPIGVWIGAHWARCISERLFYRFLYAGMLLTGLKLVWDGLLA